MAEIEKYSRFVVYGKRFLWFMVAVVISIVIYIGSNNTGENGGRMVFTNMPKGEIMENIMKKPRYQGVDVNNRPYTIDAANAIQKDKETVLLKAITADMVGDNNAWMALKATDGELNTTTKQLELTGGVEVFYEGGYQFRTERAHVDISNNSVKGDSPIDGNGASGSINAQSFTISERGNKINFNGSVRMLLYR